MIYKWLLECMIGGHTIWYSREKVCRDFTTDAYEAMKFDNKYRAEKYMADHDLIGWLATEHGFESIEPKPPIGG